MRIVTVPNKKYKTSLYTHCLGTIALVLIKSLSPEDLTEVMVCFRDLLKSHSENLNSLNVYPVPDGDTGSNMAATLDSVVSELSLKNEKLTFDLVLEAIAHGSLMGARGNSGVIICQILRGFTSEIKKEIPENGINAKLFSTALSASAKAAYEAVGTPVEGTILTVVRESAEAAVAEVRDGTGLLEVVQIAREAAKRSLDKTPELLPVLADAGVVDAGGSGFLLMLDALLSTIDGRPLPEPEILSAVSNFMTPDVHDENMSTESRYEVMYFLETRDEAIDEFKKNWAEIGDSIVVVGGEGTWNCHVHTNDIGAAVEAGISVGRPFEIRVTDLFEEVAERSAQTEKKSLLEEESMELLCCAVVAVSNGDGVRQIFRSLGVSRFVDGGQSMNPSTLDLLEAVESAPAEHVVLLPNNPNIVAVAEQVDYQTKKSVYVVKTHSVTEGFASLLSYDPEVAGELNYQSMTLNSQSVESGEVTVSVRDSSSDIGEIKKGNFLGLSKGKVKVVAPSLFEATIGLLEEMISDDHELVTMVEGLESNQSVTKEIVKWLNDTYADLEVEVHKGGQPLYPYYVGIE